jgi:hypothetical protein
VRLLSDARIITNIDGIEWKREKWNRLARWFLRLSEKVAVRWSHVVVADNEGIAEHVAEVYGLCFMSMDIRRMERILRWSK